MNLQDAVTLAELHMEAHGLIQQGWHFQFDAARRRFGQCNYSKRTIKLSRALTLLNEEETVEQTILHEVAHALCSPWDGHGPQWVRMARSIGCTGSRCYDSSQVVQPPAPYKAVCATCGTVHRAYKRRTRATACSACCQVYAGGKFDARFALTFVQVATGRTVSTLRRRAF